MQCRGNKVVQEKKILEVAVERGMQNNQKIVFRGEADEAVRGLGDLLGLPFSDPSPPAGQRPGRHHLRGATEGAPRLQAQGLGPVLPEDTDAVRGSLRLQVCHPAPGRAAAARFL